MNTFEILVLVLLGLILLFVVVIWSGMDDLRRDMRILNQIMERNFGTVMKELVRRR